MTLTGLTVKNIGHNWLRTVLTVVATAIAVLSFVMIRTTLSAWEAGVENAAQDRLATIHSVTFVMPLPKRYFDEFNGSKGKLAGIKHSTFLNWFGAKHPLHESSMFANMAVDTDTFFDVYSEMEVPAAQLAAWKENRQGAIIGEALATQFGWKVGDDVTLVGTIYPGDWKFKIEGIYVAKKKSVDRAQFLFHWKYVNESLPEDRRDQIGWIASTIDSANQAASISEAIDAKFDVQDVQTRTMSERSLNMEFLGSASAIFDALDVVSLVIMGIMTLILGNTIAMSVRERTREYGVLLALGFRPKHIASFVLGEGVTVGLLGGGLGLLLSYPLLERGLGRWIEDNMGAWMPYFSIPTSVALIALAMAGTLAAIAAVIPAYTASKLNVIDALRRLG
ncbi:MAG: FtsX-like permease family protein [Deltaproteobacteria bacterium]|nr:FtsX-like permease family protein [Nannocystaceae bacterium]